MDAVFGVVGRRGTAVVGALGHPDVDDYLRFVAARARPNTLLARITERAPTIAATINDYLDQLSVRLRPNSLRTIDTSLRLFAGYLVDHHPDVTAIAAVRRTHVQGYKSWLAARHGHRGPVLANQTLRGRLGTLAAFFARLEELDIGDAPTRSPVLPSDLPIKDDPLPRFIDDAASSKLHAAAQAHPDLFTRTAVELLARTGLRKSELLGLTVDAVVQIGSTYWLRIPVGKLHTDRYDPLHPKHADPAPTRAGHGPGSRLKTPRIGEPLPALRASGDFITTSEGPRGVFPDCVGSDKWANPRGRMQERK